MDTYLVHLEQGEFASVRVNQRNVSLYTLVYDPLDTLVQVVDDNGIGHSDVVSLYASIRGDYTLKVAWNFVKPLTGIYELTLDRIEKAGRDSIEKTKQLFDSWYTRGGPGGAAIVVKNNQVIFEGYAGMANLEEGLPITRGSIFELASVSKQFTALAVAMLLDQKKISLADDIRKYVPELPDYGSTITVSNLVYHTSGLRDFVECFHFAGITPEDIVTQSMVIKFAAAQQYLKFIPGEKYNYSNTNYVLLAEIVARVTGRKFADWMKENIFLPLDMGSTFVKETPGHIYAKKVLNYRPEDSGYVQRMLNNASMGSQACYSSADDLVKWVNEFSNKKLINPFIDSLLVTTGTLNDGKKTGYAFGNNISKYKGFDKIDHLGLFCGYRTSIARFPKEGLSIIYLSNDDNDASYGRATKIADLFLRARPYKPSTKRIPDAAKVLREMVESDTALSKIPLEQFTGIYFSRELGSSLTIAITDHRLVIKHGRLNDIPLKHSADDSFGFIQFFRNEAGAVKSFRILGENMDFRRVTE